MQYFIVAMGRLQATAAASVYAKVHQMRLLLASCQKDLSLLLLLQPSKLDNY
jgi:hypothetical protein